MFDSYFIVLSRILLLTNKQGIIDLDGSLLSVLSDRIWHRELQLQPLSGASNDFAEVLDSAKLFMKQG